MCPHPSFVAHVNVQRITETGGFYADITISCVQCETPFAFVGVPIGSSPEHPTTSVDHHELRVPIVPKGEKATWGHGFSVSFGGEAE